jgi:hypothetical protein
MNSRSLTACNNHNDCVIESQDLDILYIVIISGTLTVLFVALVIFIVPLLLCGLCKRFRSNPVTL